MQEINKADLRDFLKVKLTFEMLSVRRQQH